MSICSFSRQKPYKIVQFVCKRKKTISNKYSEILNIYLFVFVSHFTFNYYIFFCLNVEIQWKHSEQYFNYSIFFLLFFHLSLYVLLFQSVCRGNSSQQIITLSEQQQQQHWKDRYTVQKKPNQLKETKRRERERERRKREKKNPKTNSVNVRNSEIKPIRHRQNKADSTLSRD